MSSFWISFGNDSSANLMRINWLKMAKYRQKSCQICEEPNCDGNVSQ